MAILYIVATPIGNLKDLTWRALEVLQEVDLVVCEDTRQTVKLLNHYQIKKPLVSYFQHSRLGRIEYIAGELAVGKKVALVTDAGTPGISDPGGKLIEEILRLLPSDLRYAEGFGKASEGRAGWGVENLNTSPSISPSTEGERKLDKNCSHSRSQRRRRRLERFRFSGRQVRFYGFPAAQKRAAEIF